MILEIVLFFITLSVLQYITSHSKTLCVDHENGTVFVDRRNNYATSFLNTARYVNFISF